MGKNTSISLGGHFESFDQVIEHLVVFDKVQRGLNDSAEGKVYSKEEAREKS